MMTLYFLHQQLR